MRELYRQAWNELAALRNSCNEIDRECTPVLAFGKWKTACVVTAGLNPSEDEFRDKNQRDSNGMKHPLEANLQRFLHWGEGQLTEALIDEAFAKSEGYFELGNAYGEWFGKYNTFLKALGVSFEDGTACHTDYVSPFATKTGISKCARTTRNSLTKSGKAYWLDVLERCPRLELVFGHGRGWRLIPEIFGIIWHDFNTLFDQKGGDKWNGKAHLSFSEVRLPVSGRLVKIYWWRPNRDGSPLCFLSAAEARLLGEQVAAHAEQMKIIQSFGTVDYPDEEATGM